MNRKILKSRITSLSLLFAAAFATLSGLAPSSAHAEKNINFDNTGSVNSTLVFNNQVVPDVYQFFAVAGEQIRLQTSNNSFDTTIRVIGPDAAINLFDDDGGGSLASRLVFTAADSGAYIVVVSSFSGNPGTNANYTLNFARGAAANAVQALAAARAEPDGDSDPAVSNEIEEKQ
jgi:Bacterial pre-peptidase C-terminal domain